LKILLTGRSGQVGAELERVLAPLGELAATDRATLDLGNPRSIEAAVRRAQPQVIVNAAAYTAVDRAEKEVDAAFAVNATAPAVLAAEARALDALLVHYSTDYVFDGEKPAPYVETDPVAPLNVYGRSKLAGEQAVAASGCRHFIFRTSWVYGPRGRNFLHAILAAAREKPELRVVDDQRGAPTSAEALAVATAQVLAEARLRAQPSGLYHMSAAGETTWHGFARAIVEGAGMAIPVLPISSDQYPVAARRPRNSLLDNRKLAATFGTALPDWRSGLAAVLPAVH
jgi:dTDP-4-dehydrorhamnose reductase